MSAGLIFAKACQRSGYFVFDLNEYPSLIRGGHNTYTVRVSDEKIFSQDQTIELLLALNQNAIDFHQKELSSGAAILVNTDKIDLARQNFPSDLKIFPVPLVKIAKESGGKDVMMNNVALGALAAILKADFQILAGVIEDVFGELGKEMVDLNIKAAMAGFDFVRENFKDINLNFGVPPRETVRKLLLTGNDAIALGAVRAGLKFFSCYPMTPINSILTYLAKKAPEADLVYIQPEDEISGINMAIGSAIAGARSMVATSGGGFALMAEGYGLAGMTETPLVIVEGQRPGPATGLPTWGGQGDLFFVLHAAQDDFLRIVLAPGDPEECFWLTIGAFNLAEKYQTPVIILTDKHLSESHETTDLFDQSKIKIDRGLLMAPEAQKQPYKRYEITASGVSPRALPGRPGFTFVANSDEHNEFGFSEESAQNRKDQMEKRMRKLAGLAKEIPDPKIYGNKQAKLTLVGWGSSKGPILEARKILEKEGIETNFLHLNYLNPFPDDFVLNFLKSAERTLIVEQNATAQCADLIRAKTGVEIKDRFLKYDGRPLFPEEIAQYVKEII